METTYSQSKEDLFVLNYFGDYRGRLLDVGANDGTTFSNSRLLIENGWGANLVEPGSVFKELHKLYKENPNVELSHCGIGLKTGFVKFWDSGAHVKNGKDTGLVSTLNFDETKRWDGVEFNETTASIMSFDDFYKCSSEPTFDFISVDCEGNDWIVLQQIDLDKVACRCLCIEHNGDEKLLFLYRRYCDKFDMREVLINGENIIFVK
jgi:FkbM family methyltransferase